MAMLLPEDRPNEETEILGRIGRGERVQHFETVRRNKDGDRIGVDLFRLVGENVAAVLLDVTMPVMGGEETLGELKEMSPG